MVVIEAVKVAATREQGQGQDRKRERGVRKKGGGRRREEERGERRRSDFRQGERGGWAARVE